MAVHVGLDVSLRMTPICVVEADGSPVWEGKAEKRAGLVVKSFLALARQYRSQVETPCSPAHESTTARCGRACPGALLNS
jgi:hypothetical protein